MSNGDWTRDEVEATVADYFVILESELEPTQYRARVGPALQGRLG